MIGEYLEAAAGWGKEVYFNNKGRVGRTNWPRGAGCYEWDRMQLEEIGDEKWQCPMTMGELWFYSSEEEMAESYKSSTQLIHHLCDIVSKNGNFLLNIGPRPDGTIPEAMQTRLMEIGDWLKINGEAIYGTRPWVTFGQVDPEVRFTTKGKTLFAILLEKVDEPFIINLGDDSHGTSITAVSLLGSDAPVKWNHVEAGVRVLPPDEWPGGSAWAFRIRRTPGED